MPRIEGKTYKKDIPRESRFFNLNQGTSVHAELNSSTRKLKKAKAKTTSNDNRRARTKDRTRKARKYELKTQRKMPKPKGLGIVPWAKEKYIISQRRVSATKWKTENWAPISYLCDILKIATSSQRPKSIALWKGSQLGYTQSVGVLIAHSLLERASRVLVVMPHEGLAAQYRKLLVDPLFERMPDLVKLKESSRDWNNSRGKAKTFSNGATLVVQGGSTGNSYRSQAVDLQLLDELDGYAKLDEGDAFTLSLRAITNTGGILIAGSTPTTANEGESQIIDAYCSSDIQFAFAIPCPHCQEYDGLVWERMHWPAEGTDADRAQLAQYHCGSCGSGWTWERKRMLDLLKQGKWLEAKLPREGTDEAQFPEIIPDGRYVHKGRLYSDDGQQLEWPPQIGFAINSLFSAWSSWPEFVKRWLQATGDTQKTRAFVEQVLARPYSMLEETLDHAIIREQAIPMSEMPDSFRFGVCAVDVQAGTNDQSFISAAVWIFGPEDEGALMVDRQEFYDEINYHDAGAWKQLADWLKTNPSYQGRVISRLVVDGGYRQSVTIRACNMMGFSGTYIVKGMAGWGLPTTQPMKKSPEPSRHRQFILGVDGIKLQFLRGLASGKYRIVDSLPETIEKEMTAERLRVRVRQGRKVKYWHQELERNEALDQGVYAIAANAIAKVPNIGNLPIGKRVGVRARRKMGKVHT